MKSRYFRTVVFFLIGLQIQSSAQEIWQGALTTAGRQQIPFRLFLDLTTSPPLGYFLNGSERTKIPEIIFRNDSLSLFFSGYNAAMIGTRDANSWHGNFYRYRGDTAANGFSASPENVSSSPGPEHSSFDGKFRVYLFDEKTCDSTMTASFWSARDSIYGTFIAPDGDFGLFAGVRQNESITLSRFTGWQAFLLEAKQDGLLWKGTLTSRSGVPQKFTLIPIRSQKNVSDEIVTTMKRPNDRFTFAGTTVTGDTIRSDQEQFKGKALIVDIMGTWCHNCMDAAPLLQKLYAEYHEQGLEIVSLSFEISADPALAKKNLSLFRGRYGVTFPILFCGSMQESNIAARLHSQLNNFCAYPTALFIDKQGVVRTIHVGFHGPGTGEEYSHQIEEYRSLIQDIIHK